MSHQHAPHHFEQLAAIDAPIELVWEILTDIDLMPAWMAEPQMPLKVETSWTVGTPIVVRGIHHIHFTNTGTVLAFEPKVHLAFTHLSSLSRLPDTPESHSVIEFSLMPAAERTLLKLRVSGFPTESIFRHLQFYWESTIGVLKLFIEKQHGDVIPTRHY